MTNPTTPVRPRDAASLIIYRQRRSGLEVLMGCRNQKARFKPGIYVFPGGMLERSDHFVRPASSLKAKYAKKMGVNNSRSKAQSLAVAAIRETFEEVGLRVAKSVKFNVSNNAAWTFFRNNQIAPNPAPLAYLGRAITPARWSIRFDARFFFVSANETEGDMQENGELTDLRWVRLGKHHNLNMMRVTHLMLDTLTEHVAARSTRTPFLYFINGHTVLKYV